MSAMDELMVKRFAVANLWLIWLGGEAYRRYRSEVPALVPFWPKF